MEHRELGTLKLLNSTHLGKIKMTHLAYLDVGLVFV